jgi:lysophospholipase L1-like esterase/pectate lyase
MFLSSLFGWSVGEAYGVRVEAPVHVYVVGDSTAAAYPSERHPLTGWAQLLQEHFDVQKAVVEDRAKSGRSSKSFVDEGAWANVLADVKAGDYVFIQFGHNDSKSGDPARYTDPDTTYKSFLTQYVADTRSKGAFPVIMTSINRNAWENETTPKDTLGGYPEAARDVAKELDVPLIDASALTRKLFEELGQEKTTRLFMNLDKGAFPNYPDGSSDNTHLQERGARVVSRIVADAVSRMEIPLKDALISGSEVVPAFPGAEGYGKWAKGGRGGDVYHVTTLADSGPGSLREGIVSAHAPRTVVFDLSGTIQLASAIKVVNKACLTIAGQTAPGDGITLKDYGLEFDDSRDIVLRYLRLRMGDQNKPKSGQDVVSVDYCDDFIIDHCSLSWGIDGNQDMRGATGYTMQWCILSEALNKSLHEKGAHAMCASFRQPRSNISIHHNLFSTCRERHPTIGGNEFKPEVIVDFRNNVDYNWTGAANIADSQTNLVGNYFRPGPETDVARGPIAMKTLLPKEAHGYMAGNVFEGREDLNADNYAAVDFTRWLGKGNYQYEGTVDDWKVSQPFEVGAYAPPNQSATEAYDAVLARAGVSLKRDAVDVRVIENVRNKRGKVIDSQDDVGGWPLLESLPAPVDTDQDGMPDAWENGHRLNPRNADDRNEDRDRDGYTNLEEYLNGLCGEERLPQIANDSTLRTTGPETVFDVTHNGVVNPIQRGKWRLGGVAVIRFVDRVEPHESSVLALMGPGLQALEGRFSELRLPSGWQGDLIYNDKAKTVTLKNLRPDRAPAFPGAEGFGKYTMGGRGGRVIEVTNLNDSGPGSLRAACEEEGPRTVVFRVSGTIALESELEIKNPFITIAGQSAPGDGICLKNYQFSFETQHVIVRYIRVRPGDEKGKEQDAFGGGGDHIIVDHCSVSWGVDETLSINKASNLSVQWCMVTESLTRSLHKKGSHGYGGLWGGPGGSFHHNILAHHSSRNPRASGNKESGLLDYRNNVVYNWGFNSAYGGELWPRNWINNYYKSGPATSGSVRDRIFLQKDPRGKMYCAGNFVLGYPAITRDNWAGGIDYSPDGEANEQTLRAYAPFVVAPVKTQPAAKAYKRVLRDAGCSLRRDAVDTRIIEEIRTGTARFGETYGGGGKGLIDSQSAVGGWPELKSLPAPADSDHDGMPDDWEGANRLDSADALDGAQDADSDGYTNLEEYLNSLVRL